ncbi:MAG: enoyl-CoA hydratase/isomerase family protein [Oscillospiraceae bacterium]|nr:enoyl-CoA hydratase/isomerase family protein [Oscillospiraceae bacterium]
MNKKYETLMISESNSTAIITFDAPYSNRMSMQFIDDLSSAVETCIEAKPDGIILTGAGRHFSVGADVDELRISTSSGTELDKNGSIVCIPEKQNRIRETLIRLSKLSCPVAAAIKGFCIGSGAELAYFCHFRICERSMKIGSPESTFGIMPGLGGCVNTYRLCGLQASLDMVLTGKLLTFEEAERNNIVDIVSEKNKSLETALNLISFINSQGKYDPEDKYQIISRFTKEVTRI